MRRIFLAAAICAGLAACGGQPIDPDATAPRIDDQSMAARDLPAPVADSTPKSVAPAQQAAIDPASLVGMTGARISSLFGDPVFVRRDAPGEFWRYRGKSCVLELFFYLRDGTAKVDHIETRASGGATLNRWDCIATLRKSPTKT